MIETFAALIPMATSIDQCIGGADRPPKLGACQKISSVLSTDEPRTVEGHPPSGRVGEFACELDGEGLRILEVQFVLFN